LSPIPNTFNNSCQFYACLDSEIRELGKINIYCKAAAFSQSGMFLDFSCTEYQTIFHIMIINSSTLEVECIITNLPTFANKIMWLDNDRLIIALLEDNSIFCWSLGETRTIFQENLRK